MSACSTASALLGYERGITACKQRHAVSSRPCAQMLLSPAGRPSRAGRTGDADWGPRSSAVPATRDPRDHRHHPGRDHRPRRSGVPARPGSHRGRDRHRRDHAANSGCHLRLEIMAGYPRFLAGAGTLLEPAQVARAAGAGALFAVSPGFDPWVVDHPDSFQPTRQVAAGLPTWPQAGCRFRPARRRCFRAGRSERRSGSNIRHAPIPVAGPRGRHN
jgi:KDPG/KHG aldolase